MFSPDAGTLSCLSTWQPSQLVLPSHTEPSAQAKAAPGQAGPTNPVCHSPALQLRPFKTCQRDELEHRCNTHSICRLWQCLHSSLPWPEKKQTGGGMADKLLEQARRAQDAYGARSEQLICVWTGQENTAFPTLRQPLKQPLPAALDPWTFRPSQALATWGWLRLALALWHYTALSDLAFSISEA